MTAKANKLIFMGSPDFALPTLRGLIADGYDIICVYSQPPRSGGRGKLRQITPVQKLANEFGIPVRTPPHFNYPKDRDDFAALNADLAIVVAYGLILPNAVLNAPRLGCVNLHGSRLPRWRGAAPIQRAIMQGDEETAIAIMQMEQGLDTGPVFIDRALSISPRTTAGELHDQLAVLAAELLSENLPAILAESLTATAQTGESSYARKIQKAEGSIDWTQPADWIDRQIRGLSPFPGAWFDIQGRRIKLLLAEPVSGVSGPPGQVLDESLVVGCGRGALRLLRLQRAGKSVMDADEFQRGFRIEQGVKLE